MPTYQVHDPPWAGWVERLVNSGSFQALGQEVTSTESLVFILPVIGMLGSALTMVFSIFFGFGNYPASSLVDVLLVSLTILVVSGGLLLYTRRFYHDVSILDIYYEDRKSAGQGVLLSYVSPRKKKRSALLVKKVEARPTIPLWEPSGTFRVGIEGTRSSIVVRLRSRYDLVLGFSSEDEMWRSYRMIGGLG